MSTRGHRAVSSRISSRIRSIYDLYHNRAYLGIDPLVTLHRFRNRDDLEVAALVAAVLSYGRVETTIRNVDDLFRRMEYRPAAFMKNTGHACKRRAFRGFRHRFNSGNDMALLLQSVAPLIDTCGSLESFFADAFARSATGIRGALERFSGVVREVAGTVVGEVPPSFFFLVPTPAGGGACKRLNMYLRWMVRPEDGIDFGIWNRIAPSELVIPVDTHIARVARAIRITRRKAVNWRMAEEITAYLKRIDGADPVRFDFSLCRFGMLDVRKDAA